MSRRRRQKARAKVTQQMTRAGLVEENHVTGEVTQISNRETEQNFRPAAPANQPARATEQAVNRQPDAGGQSVGGGKKKRRRHRHRKHSSTPRPESPQAQPSESCEVPAAAPPSAQSVASEQPKSEAGFAEREVQTPPLRAGRAMPPPSKPGKPPVPAGRRSKLLFREPAAPGKPVTATATAKQSAAEITRVGADKLHQKVAEIEGENTGVQSAHSFERATESAARRAYRFSKRRTASRTYGIPKRRSAVLQKRKIKKDYANVARQSKTAVQRVKEAGTSAAKALTSTIRRHSVACLVLVLVVLLVYLVMSLFTVALSFGGGGMGGVFAASYLAADADINEAELRYTEWETDLAISIEDMESTEPGYDEYRYSIGGIGHGPYTLMAYLTAVHHEFTYDGIAADLQSLFAEQYTLTSTPSAEVHYENGEPQERTVLTVTLTVKPLPTIVYERMNAEQLGHYTLLLQSQGGRQVVDSPFPFDWLPHVSNRFGYRIHPISGIKDAHMGIDIALPTGTEILAAHAGTVTYAGFNASYGNIIILEGGDGLVTKYAHCDSLLGAVGQVVEAGAVIATVGSTGNSTGSHLHFEVLKDGQYLNPTYFAHTGGAI